MCNHFYVIRPTSSDREEGVSPDQRVQIDNLWSLKEIVIVYAWKCTFKIFLEVNPKSKIFGFDLK